jgi:predicted DNA-binding antitoxin AbrB/MazE fold protein
MSQTIEAVYQDGVFRPLRPLSPEPVDGAQVLINVESRDERRNRIMDLADNFYEGLSEEDIDEIEKIALDRSNFFGERTP